jgi:hypothetical protein
VPYVSLRVSMWKPFLRAVLNTSMPQASIIGLSFVFFSSVSGDSHGASFLPVGHVLPGLADPTADPPPAESAVNAKAL